MAQGRGGGGGRGARRTQSQAVLRHVLLHRDAGELTSSLALPRSTDISFRDTPPPPPPLQKHAGGVANYRSSEGKTVEVALGSSRAEPLLSLHPPSNQLVTANASCTLRTGGVQGAGLRRDPRYVRWAAQRVHVHRRADAQRDAAPHHLCARHAAAQPGLRFARPEQKIGLWGRVHERPLVSK